MSYHSESRILITGDALLLIFQAKSSTAGRKGVFSQRAEMLSATEGSQCGDYRERWAPHRSTGC